MTSQTTTVSPRPELLAAAARPEPVPLRTAVKLNAAYCACSGVAGALAAFALDDWLGLHAIVLVIVGVGLAGYAGLLWVGAAEDRTLIPTGQMATAGDLGWIVMAVVIIAFTDLLTSAGNAVLAGLTVVVAGFFVVQGLALRRVAAAT